MLFALLTAKCDPSTAVVDWRLLWARCQKCNSHLAKTFDDGGVVVGAEDPVAVEMNDVSSLVCESTGDSDCESEECRSEEGEKLMWWQGTWETGLCCWWFIWLWACGFVGGRCGTLWGGKELQANWCCSTRISRGEVSYGRWGVALSLTHRWINLCSEQEEQTQSQKGTIAYLLE